MTITQIFTGRGLLGAALFVIGAPCSGLAFWLWSRQPAYDSSNTLLYVAAAFSIAQLASVPMMLVGRMYEVSGIDQRRN